MSAMPALGEADLVHDRPAAARTARPRVFKRLLDVTASAIGLVVLAPVFAAAALTIRLDSPGPVFYRQERIGRHGRPFRIVKFRSMTHNTDRGSNHVTVAGDPRITRVGAFLRKTKIDEFPQLINVLLGQMSLVGPRPEVAQFVEQYDERQRGVLAVLPGITSTASIAYRDEEDQLSRSDDPAATYLHDIMPKKLDMNLAYIERENVLRDVGVILRTLAAVWRSR